MSFAFRLLPLAVVLGTQSYSAAAQVKPVCGWDRAELAGDVPATVSRLLSRSPDPTIFDPALRKLRLWVSACDEKAGRDAHDLFRRAASRQRESQAGAALAAVVLARGPDVRVEGGSGVLYAAARGGSRQEREAAKLLRQVGDATGWLEVGQELAALGLATRTRETLTSAAELLHSMAGRQTDPAVWPLLAEVQLAQGDTAGAAASSRAGAECANGSAARTLGIARLRAGDLKGADDYLAGIDAADDHVLVLYLEDIRALLAPDEAPPWSSLSLAEKRSWLRNAWEWRAAIATLSVPERLAEHFRRLYFAYEHYTRMSYRGAPRFDALWGSKFVGLTRLDDRGITYVRHGDPDETIRLSAPGAVAESWMYARLAGGVALIQFVKDARRPDYYVSDPAPGIPQPSSAGISMASQKVVANAHESYGNAIFNFLKTKVPCGHVWGCVPDALWRESFAAPVDRRRWWGHAIYASETARPRLTSPLRALLDTYAFRGRGDSTDLAVMLAVEAEDILADTADDQRRYTLRFFASVVDTTTRSVVRRDSIVSFTSPAALGADAVVRYSSMLTAAPTPTATIRASVRNQMDSIQGEIVTLQREIPHFWPYSLGVSDLVIADTVDGTWSRGAVALAPRPGHRIQSGDRFRLFYEVYGVPGDGLVDVSIDVLPGREPGLLNRIKDLLSRRQAMQLRFQEPASAVRGNVMQVLRLIEAELESGTYTLAVTVSTGQPARSASAETTLVVYSAH